MQIKHATILYWPPHNNCSCRFEVDESDICPQGVGVGRYIVLRITRHVSMHMLNSRASAVMCKMTESVGLSRPVLFLWVLSLVIADAHGMQTYTTYAIGLSMHPS